MLAKKNDPALEQTLRRLLKAAHAWAQYVAGASPGSHHHEEVEDTIAEAEYLLKRLGGVASRSAPQGPRLALGQCS